MKSTFKITIPKPCYENWSSMTPKVKGRFCSLCSKTVIDFTKQSEKEIQKYLIENKYKRVCGRFYKKQLDSIIIEIPELTFHQKLSFQKLFILILFFVMGTTLFSCQYSDGQKQKIENIILIDSVKQTITDSNTQLEEFCTSKNDGIIDDIALTGELSENNITDGLIEVVGDVGFSNNDETTFGLVVIEEPPRFKEAEHLSKENAKRNFNKRMQKLIADNFNIKLTQNLGLPTGKHKIFTLFTIDEIGKATNIKVKAPHPKLEKEVSRIIKKLPQLIPAKQSGKIVKMKYSLPITFMVD